MSWRRRLNGLALLTLLGYVWLASGTERGAADPVWRRIHERGTLVVATDIGFAPFVEQRPDGQLDGYDVRLMEEIARRLGLRLEWRQAGYDALFSGLDPGNPNQVDVLAAGVALNPAEGWRARYTSAYFDAGPRLVVRPDSAIASSADLGGLRLAVQLGSPGETLARRIVAADPSVTIDNHAATQDEAIARVLSGDADAAIVETVVALPYVERGTARIAAGLEFEPYVLAVPVSAYQLQAALNRILDDLRIEGWFDRLHKQLFR